MIITLYDLSHIAVISSIDQNVAHQILKMKSLGIEEKYIFIDKQSGKDFNRPEYQLLKTFYKEDNLVYIDSHNRLEKL